MRKPVGGGEEIFYILLLVRATRVHRFVQLTGPHTSVSNLLTVSCSSVKLVLKNQVEAGVFKVKHHVVREEIASGAS